MEAPDYKFYIQVHGEGRLCESNSLRDTTNLVCMDTGWQHLNGEQALAYARNRHGFLESDIARNRHQQQIIEAMAKKLLKLNNFSEMENIIDSVSKNIATNLQTNQLLSLYQTLKNMLISGLKGNDFIKIQKTYLEYYNLRVLIPYYNAYVSAIGYYQGSMDAITKAMRINLELETEEMVKTFNYDYHEEYTASVVGKNIRTGEKLTLVPDFTGKTISEVETWGLENNITINKEFTCSTNLPGVISSQSVGAGALTKSINELTVYIGQTCQNPGNNDTPENPSTTPEPPEEEQPEIPGLPEVNEPTDNPVEDDPNKDENTNEETENNDIADNNDNGEENIPSQEEIIT